VDYKTMQEQMTICNKPGYMVWGVNDDTHEVKGTNFRITDAKQGNQDLELWIRNLLHPKISFEIFEFDYYGNPVVLLLLLLLL
jgi:predicted HTH transcriptional regulator